MWALLRRLEEKIEARARLVPPLLGSTETHRPMVAPHKSLRNKAIAYGY